MSWSLKVYKELSVVCIGISPVYNRSITSMDEELWDQSLLLFSDGDQIVVKNHFWV